MKSNNAAFDLGACVQALQDIIADPDRARELAEEALAGMMRRRIGVAAPVQGRKPVKIPDLPVGGWAKWVLSVNNQGKGGFAFDGPFLRLGSVAPLPEHAVVLLVSPLDTMRQRPVHVAYVTETGDLNVVYKDRSAHWWIECKRCIEKMFSEWAFHHFAPSAAAAASVVGPTAPPDHIGA